MRGRCFESIPLDNNKNFPYICHMKKLEEMSMEELYQLANWYKTWIEEEPFVFLTIFYLEALAITETYEEFQNGTNLAHQTLEDWRDDFINQLEELQQIDSEIEMLTENRKQQRLVNEANNIIYQSTGDYDNYSNYDDLPF